MERRSDDERCTWWRWRDQAGGAAAAARTAPLSFSLSTSLSLSLKPALLRTYHEGCLRANVQPVPKRRPVAIREEDAHARHGEALHTRQEPGLDRFPRRISRVLHARFLCPRPPARHRNRKEQRLSRTLKRWGSLELLPPRACRPCTLSRRMRVGPRSRRCLRPPSLPASSLPLAADATRPDPPGNTRRGN